MFYMSNMISVFSSTYLSLSDFKLAPSYFINLYNYSEYVHLHYLSFKMADWEDIFNDGC